MKPCDPHRRAAELLVQANRLGEVIARILDGFDVEAFLASGSPLRQGHLLVRLLRARNTAESLAHKLFQASDAVARTRFPELAERYEQADPETRTTVRALLGMTENERGGP